LGVGKAIPYGIYDVNRNGGMVNVGISHDMSEFAVESIRRWWFLFGVVIKAGNWYVLIYQYELEGAASGQL
jgi:hypothetical protein